MSVERRFVHLPLTTERLEAMTVIMDRFRALAVDLGDRLPPGREASLVMTKLEEACMWALKSLG